MEHVDPPDLGLWPTLRRLFPLWWEQRRLVALGLACALAFTALSITIPILIQRVVDEAIVGTQDERLLPYLGAIVVLATLRFGVNFTRRFATARVGIAVEARLRGMLYHAYLTYPRAFFDRHATGEVISRATNDIYPVRYFIGWGVVQGIQSAMMITGAAIVLVAVNARLALYAALAMPPIAILTWFFAHRLFPISRLVQARKGTSPRRRTRRSSGIEMVQAFGREEDVRTRFLGRAEAVRHETMRAASVEAHFLPGLLFLPSLGIAAVLLFGGRDVIAGELTIGEFMLFISLLLMLVWPLEALGWIINLGQRAVASAGRSFAWLDGIEPLPEPAEPRTPGGPAARRLRGRPLRLRDRGGGAPRRRPDRRARRDRRRLRPDRRRQDDAAQPAPALLRPDRRTRARRRRRHARRPVVELRQAVALVTQRPVLFSVLLRENLLSARPDADWEEVLAACDAAGVSAFVDDLPEGYETLIGERGVNLSGGQRQRVALAQALLAARACSCSTTRCPPSTRRPSGCSSRTSGRRWRAGRCSSRPSASPRSASPTARSCSTRAGSSSRAAGCPARRGRALHRALRGRVDCRVGTTPGSPASSPTPPSARARWR